MITAWIVVTVVSKSATSALMETFIADWSSTMTNCAMANATSGNQFVFGVSPVSVTLGCTSSHGCTLLGIGVLPERRRVRRDVGGPVHRCTVSHTAASPTPGGPPNYPVRVRRRTSGSHQSRHQRSGQ